MKIVTGVSSQAASSGFSLFELFIVMAIVSILALAAVPSFTNKMSKEQVMESAELVAPYKRLLSSAYLSTGQFATSNEEAGLPEPGLIRGNYLQSVVVREGGLHLTFGGKASTRLMDKVLTIRPTFVPQAPEVPISWVCGFDEIPDGMLSPTENLTDVANELLPLVCR